MQEVLNLKWDSFSSQLTNSLDVCYEKQFFVDLSLVCKNGTTLKCHKMILANASSFFRRLLVRNEHPHPMIILHDIEADDLKTIINFMYCGEIQVVKSEVRRILKIAEILEVSGLKDIRTKLLVPNSTPSSRDASGKFGIIENTTKNVDSKSPSKINFDEEPVASTSTCVGRQSIAARSLYNVAERCTQSARPVDGRSKCRTNSTGKHDKVGHSTQPQSTSGRNAANHRPSTGSAGHDSHGAESGSRKRMRADEPITWTKVLSQISKENEASLKRLCVMDEVEITATAAPRSLPELDPLDTTGMYIKEEIDCDNGIDDYYDSNTATTDVDDGSQTVFRTIDCNSGSIHLTTAKSVNSMEVRGSNDSCG